MCYILFLECLQQEIRVPPLPNFLKDEKHHNLIIDVCIFFLPSFLLIHLYVIFFLLYFPICLTVEVIFLLLKNLNLC